MGTRLPTLYASTLIKILKTIEDLDLLYEAEHIRKVNPSLQSYSALKNYLKAEHKDKNSSIDKVMKALSRRDRRAVQLREIELYGNPL